MSFSEVMLCSFFPQFPHLLPVAYSNADFIIHLRALITTEWAARFTPQANVSVQHRTRTKPRSKSSSLSFRSARSMPA
ncbi:hypothetical protein PsorP6_012279 [Peronosclerospora sorghi]|uniref:Uncharacterized protein n=1 Tax=Peronosclerospora sorghi TaxID=230839 RepID=A0ACC0WKI9_9STRA|nr:hypothetical protein PsorP6_012279 [Peronosclerospora sorghi]